MKKPTIKREEKKKSAVSLLTLGGGAFLLVFIMMLPVTRQAGIVAIGTRILKIVN